MKRILMLLFLPYFSFSQTKRSLKNDIVFKGPIYSNQDTLLVSNENRERKDSLNYIIVRGKYKSGSRHVEILEDKETKIYHWKQFYPNGKLKEEGAMTKDEIICIGNWNFYFDNGNFSKTVNYDKMLPISYSKALEIAKSKGFEMPYFDVDIVANANEQYWQIRKWVMKNGDGVSATILININDGSLKIPTDEVEKHY